jgi:hypothetical protein
MSNSDVPIPAIAIIFAMMLMKMGFNDASAPSTGINFGNNIVSSFAKS